MDETVLKLIIFIVDWSKIKVISTLFDQVNVRFHFVAKGQGTANSEILDMLGIGSSEKAVIFCLEQNIMAPSLLKEVGKKLGLNMPGSGIGFTVPLSGINAPILRVFKETVENEIAAVKKAAAVSSAATAGAAAAASGAGVPAGGEMAAGAVAPANASAGSGERRKNMNEQPQCDLIVAILNQGYSDEFMTVARGAGAGGGTVISARGLMHKGPVKFFGISVQDEKEIIIILSTRAKMQPIMEAVSRAHGIASKAEGIIFSLPAENITGIDLRG